ncbi:MAG: type II toxin-antitoxin system RatA family toxin [Rickettsia endosymbiont of Bryobia graminum]|nr:type II toxin-antitoxin system RatA family toxin [Rickettsia endosymbiont of Bryobia graminum]
MPHFHQEKILPYDAEKLFNLVLDVESYPEFIPWCEAARIISQNENRIIAELVIKIKTFTEKYQSRVTSYSSNQLFIIEVEAISGPFKYLKNSWKFSKIDTGTKVEFFIDFQMKLTIFDNLVGMFFGEATKKMIDAFEKRAQALLIPI